MNRINYIKLIKAFYDKANEDLGMTPQYLSVYFSLVHINNRTGWKERFNAVYGEVMHFAKLTSKQTYHNALQHLCDNGYITCQKGSNQYTAAVFSIIVLYLDKTSTGKAQVKHKTSTGKAEVKHKTSIGNIPKPINYKTFKPLNFKTNYTTYSLPLIFLKSKLSPIPKKPIQQTLIPELDPDSREAKLIKYVKDNCPNICKMETQISEKEAATLVKKFHPLLVKAVLTAMDNTKGLSKKYTSVKKTCEIWCNRRLDSGWKPPLEPVNTGSKPNEFVKKPQSLDYLNEAKK